jgi:hypothetical protein
MDWNGPQTMDLYPCTSSSTVIDLNRIVNKDGLYHCILNQIVQINQIFKKFDMKCKMIVRQKHTTGEIFFTSFMNKTAAYLSKIGQKSVLTNLHSKE